MEERIKKIGILKTLLDVHTMGISAFASLLKDCGYKVIIASEEIQRAADKIGDEYSQKKIAEWVRNYKITQIGISYRLDPGTAVDIVGHIVAVLKKEGLYESLGAPVKNICFAGLKSACDRIDEEYNGRIKTFCGGETLEETLQKMEIPRNNIPRSIVEGCQYDKGILAFGKHVIGKGAYKSIKPFTKIMYPEFGSKKDCLMLRLEHNFEGGFQPLMRAHSGPFYAELSRKDCLKIYNGWCKELAGKGFLDILSIGTSQLSQSNFGEKWENKLNGGGVPVNSEIDLDEIWKNSRPMLVRTYSATKNVLSMAKVFEKTINNAWNAVSLWWFNELDGRGSNSLLNNLREHIETIKYAAAQGKPLETNVSHHFAFRGCDDITYIVSAYLAAKIAKKCGIKNFILQNMLNTPKSTWGIQDLAKSRAMLRLVKELENKNFRVILQTRAGLDYFKPDLDIAKIQLAAVTAMMDDIDPYNKMSPEIIHVVSYSESLFLATPSVINESIQITRAALAEYRRLKHLGQIPDVNTDDIYTRSNQLYNSAKKIIDVMEANINELYSPVGLYIAFASGWLPVPELWSDKAEFKFAKDWKTKLIHGETVIVDHELIMPLETRINRCLSNIPSAIYNLKEKYGVDFEWIPRGNVL